MPLIQDARKELTKSYGERATHILERFYGNSKTRKNQRMGFELLPEQDKTKSLTYKMEVRLYIVDPPRFPTWPIELGKAKVSYHTEEESFWSYSEPSSSIDLRANRVRFEDDINMVRWKEWLLILVEFDYNIVKAIIESLEAEFTNKPEEIKPEHIEAMRKAHFFTQRKRDPDVGKDGDDGSIYGEPLTNDEWLLGETFAYDDSDEYESQNGTNGHR